MRVKVKQDCAGFIGGKLRKKGDVFELGENKFSSAWMTELDKPDIAEPVKVKQTKKIKAI